MTIRKSQQILIDNTKLQILVACITLALAQTFL